MSEFDTHNIRLTDAMLQLKSMYVFFLNKGIDISQPQPLPELYDLCRFYQRETGLTPMRMVLAPRPSGGDGQVFTATEARAFRPGYDVQINRHGNYIQVPFHAHEYFELLITVKGDCAVWFGDTRVEQTTGDLLLIPPLCGPHQPGVHRQLPDVQHVPAAEYHPPAVPRAVHGRASAQRGAWPLL